MSYNSVSVTSTPTLIVDSNAQRLNLILTNNGSTVCYIGQDANVSSSNGIQLNQNDTLTEDGSGRRGYLGPIYGVTSSGTADIRYWERLI